MNLIEITLKIQIRFCGMVIYLKESISRRRQHTLWLYLQCFRRADF